MAYKQPRVPEYREGDGVKGYLVQLVLFLKDFCMETWQHVRRMQRVAVVNAGTGSVALTAAALESVYPVSSVFICAGDIDPTERFGGEWAQIGTETALPDTLILWQRTA